MFPLTLGANVGTTVTGILASTVATSHPAEALQVALAHLLFNIIGILAWYPIKPMRKIPLTAAHKLGKAAARHKAVPFCYVGTVFVAIPAACYGFSVAAGV